MRWFFCFAICMLIFVPAAQAGEGDPAPGDRLCMRMNDGSEGFCSTFPSLKYIHIDAQAAGSGMTRMYFFSDGSNLSKYIGTNFSEGPLSAPNPELEWKWINTTESLAKSWNEPNDLHLLGVGGDTYGCGFIKIGKTRYGMHKNSGIDCKTSNGIAGNFLNGGNKVRGWRCGQTQCYKNKKHIDFKKVKKGSLASDSKKSDMGRVCGTYQIMRQYHVYAHNCADVDDTLMGSWASILNGETPALPYPCAYDSGRGIMRCSTPNGCVVITFGYQKELSGMKFFGQTWVSIPRDTCTAI